MKSLRRLLVLYFQFGIFQIYYNYVYGTYTMEPTCAHTTKTVEHFFNLVFAEFTDNIPVCVCVQMCTNYPTYCYPNGCFKGFNDSKRTEVNRRSKTYMKPRGGYDDSVVYLIHDHKDYVNSVTTRPTTRSNDDRNASWKEDAVAGPSSFHDLMLKYKKVPTLQMRYNLRQKMKDSKGDVSLHHRNVANSKLPLSMFMNQYKQSAKAIPNLKKRNSKNLNYLVSMFPDYQSSYSKTRHLKKYLTKREDGREVNEETIYVYNFDANNSLEFLIDNLIGKTFEKDTDPIPIPLELKNKTDFEFEMDRNSSDLNDGVHDSTNFSHTACNEIKTNDSFCLKQASSKTDNNEANTDNTSLSKSIRKISEQIDRQNNMSIDLMGHIIDSNANIILNSFGNSSRDDVKENNKTVETSTNNFIYNRTTENISVNTSAYIDVSRSEVIAKRGTRVFKKKNRQKVSKKLLHKNL